MCGSRRLPERRRSRRSARTADGGVRPQQQPVRRRRRHADRSSAITTDGSPQMLNGKLDWLYQEEIYGRGRFRAFWWSPDSTAARLPAARRAPRARVRRLRPHPVSGQLEGHRLPEGWRSKPARQAGHRAASRRTTCSGRIVDAYQNDQILIVNVGWTPDSRFVVHQVQDREQTWLDLNLADPGTAPVTPPAARDDAGLGQRERQPDLAGRRIVSLVQRAQAASSTSIA